MKTKKKILIALDLEEQAIIAVKYAEYFAEKFNYDLNILTVVENNSFISKFFEDNTVKDRVKKEIEAKIDKIIVPYKDKVAISITVAFGKPYEKIIEYANETRPSIIFMGKSEMPKYKRAFLGSNSLHVILESKIPVVTIRGNYDFEKYKTTHKEIMVPLDLSKSVSEQINASIDLAKLMNTSLLLYSVEQSGSKGKHTKMLSQMAKLKQATIEAGVECRIELVQDENNELQKLINEAAIKANASLIVIMTRAENKFSQLLLGSHARSIINNAQIPVMSIAPWDEEVGSSVFYSVIDVLGVLAN